MKYGAKILFILFIIFPVTLVAQEQNVKEKSTLAELTKTEISTLTDSITQLLRKHYVNHYKGDSIARSFRSRCRDGRYFGYTSGDSLAKIITRDLREISDDFHLFVEYHPSDTKNDNANWAMLELIQERQKIMVSQRSKFSIQQQPI